MVGRVSFGAVAAAALFALTGAARAQALETVETFSAWDGTTALQPYAVPDTATYGQTITPGATQNVLHDFTFYLSYQSGTPTQSQAYVYEWDAANGHITGSALYESGVITGPSDPAFTPVTVDTGGITLIPGTQYVLFLTTSSIPGQANGAYTWGGMFTDLYAGGSMVWNNNGIDFSALNTMWSVSTGADFAFILTFGLLPPTPPTPPTPPVPPEPPAPPRPDYGDLSRNQQAVANSLLSSFDADGSLPLPFYILSADDLRVVSGEIATAAISSGLHSAELFMGQISDPFVASAGSPAETAAPAAPIGYASDAAEPSSIAALAALGEETPATDEIANRQLSLSASQGAGSTSAAGWTIWGAAYGGAQDIDGDSDVGSADISSDNWGIATGFDYQIDGGKIGFALGGAGSNFSLANGLGSGDAAVFNAGIYGSKAFGNAYVSAAAAYAYNSVDTSRSVFGDTLEADYDAHTLSGRVEGGYRFNTTVAAIIPYAAVQSSSYFMPDYSERSVLGGPFALDYDSETQSNVRTELGARLEHIIATEAGGIKLSGRLAWVWNADSARDVTAAFQNLAAPSFVIDGAEPDRHALLVDAGAEFGLGQNLSAKLSFNGEFSGNVSAYGGAAKLSYKW